MACSPVNRRLWSSCMSPTISSLAADGSLSHMPAPPLPSPRRPWHVLRKISEGLLPAKGARPMSIMYSTQPHENLHACMQGFGWIDFGVMLEAGAMEVVTIGGDVEGWVGVGTHKKL